MLFSSSLKLNHVFRRLYRKGATSAIRYLALYCRSNGTEQNRLGLTVSAKLGHAVRRNRVRRRLREIYRLHEPEFRRGLDLVIVVRQRAMDASYQELEQAVLSLAQRLELLQPEEVR